MPGFGSGSFGSGPFGAYDWGRKSMWLDIPERPDRAYDADPNLGDGMLEKWQESATPLFEELLNFARDFEQIRDPDSIRTKFQDHISVTITSSSIEVVNRTVRVNFLDTDPSDPFAPLERTSVGWKLIDSANNEFTVNEVHKDSTAVIIVGNTLPATGSATLRPPALIRLLGADYGITVDEHDPEQFQRSSVRNAWQWLAMKGVQKAYQIIGDIAGYDIVAYPLYAISAGWVAALPVGNVFEIPLGSGDYYTDIVPARPLFDEVAADVVPADVFCWQDRGDGVTYGEQIGETMQGLAVTGSSFNATTGIWTLTITGDLSPIGWATPRWYITLVGGDAGQWWLEANPVDLGGGSWQVQFKGLATTTIGATVNIDYECDSQPSCDFCRASAIRVTIIPDEILSEPGALLAGALQRTVDKVLQVVPIHVRLTQISHIVGPIEALVGVAGQHLIATADTQRSTQAYASVGYYFDIVPADVVPADFQHLVASATTFTIP